MSSQVLHKENYLQILDQIGALAYLQSDLTLVKNKPPFNVPRLQFVKSASELVVETCRIKSVTWDEIAALLPWRMSQDLLRLVGGNSTGNFEALATRLSDYMGLTTDLNNWIAACNVPGRGLLYRTSGVTTRNWLLIMKNTHPEQLVTLGAVLRANMPETTSILATIREMGCADLFGLGSNQAGNGKGHDAMDLSPVEDVDWKSILRNKLSSVYSSGLRSNEAKDNHIESVLQNPAINNHIRQRLQWLLPENATLWDILTHNNGKSWAHLAAILVEIAERAIGKVETTFPVGNTRAALLMIVEDCKRATPFVEYVFYSPTLLPADRLAQWRASADSVMTQAELINWLGLPKEMANERLSAKQMNDHFTALTEKLNHDQRIRETVIGLMEQRNPAWKFAQFHNIEAAIFTNNAPVATPVLNFEQPSSWPGAKAFLAKLNINNDALATELDECEAGQFFSLRPKEEWPGQLTAMGAIGLQNLKVYNALLKANLLK